MTLISVDFIILYKKKKKFVSYNFAHYYSNINFIINYMFKFYSIFKPPSKYFHIIFPLKDRINNFIYKHNYKKCYYINELVIGPCVAWFYEKTYKIYV